MTEILTGIDWLQKLDMAANPAEIAAQAAEIDELQAGDETIATEEEALAGTDEENIITPALLQYVLDHCQVVSFAGRNLAGACTLTGADVDDKVLFVTGVASGTVGNQSSKFEAEITVADQIQQSEASDLSTNIYLAFIQKKS